MSDPRPNILGALLIVALAAAACGEQSSGGAPGPGAGTPPGGAGGSPGNTPPAGGAPAAAPGGDLSKCPAFSPGDDLKVCTATYLTGDGADSAGGLDIAPDGTIVYGGTLHPSAFGAPAATALGGGPAGLMRLAPDGRKALAALRLGNKVNEIAVGADGMTAAVGDFGVALVAADGKSVAWSKSLGGEGTRVALGADGTVAALAGKTVSLFDRGGNAAGMFSVGATVVNDIALDSGSKLVFNVGFKQDDGPPCSQLQIPYLRAYDYQGALKWKAYDWNRTEVGAVSECADSRGIAVTLGADGKLYYAGESHGGNTVHRRVPSDLSMFATNVKSDPYNDAYNMNGAAPVGYVARFDPATGAHQVGSIFLTRLSNNKGNAARPNAVTADAAGNVLIGGGAACCIQNATQRTVNGMPAMPEGTYAGGGFALLLSPDLKTRLVWTTWNGAMGGAANPVAVAARGGAMGILMQQAPAMNAPTTGAPLITADALQAAPGGGPSDAFLSVWRAP